ncbi:hypothetical protein GINT2_000256 [Glugoides intestinalis]
MYTKDESTEEKKLNLKEVENLTISNEKGGDEEQGRMPKRTLFNDLSNFKNSNVTLVTFGGENIKGKLVGYDEVANCVIEDENSKRFIVFGKAIYMVCEGEELTVL